MTFTFDKAVKQKSKLRMALYGPSGSGKTFSSLAIATALAAGGKVALIDTEHGSASKYADKFDFDTLQLTSFHPQNYVEAIAAAEEGQYAVLIIDSLSHAWAGKDGALELVDRAARKTPSGNSYVAWKDVTPIQNALVDKILSANIHIIATMRSKTEYSQDRDDKGKTKITKLGTVPIQRSEIEYEFDIVGSMDTDNVLTIEKTRMIDLAGLTFERPNGKLAARIEAWLSAGAPVVLSDKQRWDAFIAEHGFKLADIENALGTGRVGTWMKEHNATLDVAMSNMADWATQRAEAKKQQPAVAGK